jgi:hypothetical protein
MFLIYFYTFLICTKCKFSLQKRLQRLKPLNKSTSYSEQNKDRIRYVLKNSYISSGDLMSDSSDTDPEESNSDTGSDTEKTTRPSTKVLVIKRLSWRSADLDNVFQKLVKRVVRIRTPKGHTM